jgi:hypothetical protein
VFPILHLNGHLTATHLRARVAYLHAHTLGHTTLKKIAAGEHTLLFVVQAGMFSAVIICEHLWLVYNWWLFEVPEVPHLCLWTILFFSKKKYN